MKSQTYTVDDFFFLRIKKLWNYFWSESLAFKSICAYLFVEYFRPQSIFPVIDFLPWAQVFLGISILSMFADKKANAAITKTHVLLILFFIVINLSILTAYRPDVSLKYYIDFFQWFVIIYLISSIVTTKERFYIFLLVFFLCSFKIALGTAKNWMMRGFSFTSWGLMGPSGYFQNSGELAVLMLVLFPLSYYLYITFKDDVRKWEKYLLILAVVCPILTILGSSSRGAQLALVVQLLCMFYKKIFNIKYLIIITIVAAVGYSLLPEQQKARFESIGEDKSSIQRTLYWKNGWEMMKDHPILGVGYFNFQPYFQAYYPQDMLYKNAQLPHNIFIQIGTDAGFLGLFTYWLLISHSLLRRIPIKIGQAVAHESFYISIWKAFKLGILGFLIAGQFVTIGYYPFLWISVALQISLARAIRNSSTYS